MTDIQADQYVEQAYRQYGQYVVSSRAVADYRDGLKPVQRRILWAMWRLGLKPGHTWTKSARTVGEVIGRYHPHGDKGSYDALVSMTGDMYPLVEGQGNFGGPTDPPASMRYTEARLAPLVTAVMGPDESCVALQPNFDGTTDEPVWLPAELPFILLNGASGIAVGVTCEIPPHNLIEIAQAIRVAVARGDALTVDDLACVLGPDYGASLLVSPDHEVRQVYRTGSGRLAFRCRHTVEPDGRGFKLVVQDLAPRFSIAKFMDQMAGLQEAKTIDYAADQSAGHQIKLVVRARDHQALLDHVVPLLDTAVSFQFLANESKPDGTLTFRTDLADLLRRWVQARLVQITKTLQAAVARFDRELAGMNARRLACQNLRSIAKVLTESQDPRAALQETLPCTADQADVILGTPIGQLSRLNVDRLDREITARTRDRDDLMARASRPADELLAQVDRWVKVHGKPRGTGLMDRAWVVRSGKIGRVLRDRVRPDDLVLDVQDGGTLLQVQWADGTKTKGPVEDQATRSRDVRASRVVVSR